MTMHWSLENVYSSDVHVVINDASIDISVRAEVPILDGVRQPRHGNRYYPTLIDIEGPDFATLFPAEARDFAQKLIAAADAADAVDEPDAALCGHWAPCECHAESLSESTQNDS